MSGDRLNWWDASESVESLEDSIAAARDKVSSFDNEFLQKFSKLSAVVCVFLSNKLECTLPIGLSELETYELLEAAFEQQAPELFGDPHKLWSADGSPDSPGAKVQLLQHMKALKYLCCECKPGQQLLTVEMLKATHKLLMAGAVLTGGTPVEAGEFRTTARHSGTGYIYPDATSIEPSLTKIVAAYNSSIGSARSATAAAAVAARLMYDLVTLHPFQDGNGRLCRLVVAYALMASGTPFAVPLHNGHHNCRKHYNQVLMYSDRHCNVKRLALFILECLGYKWRNCAKNFEREQVGSVLLELVWG